MTKKIYSFSILLFLLISVAKSGFCQNYDEIEIPFFRNGEAIASTLIGGLLAPQFQAIDIDGEGLEDMVVFERNGDVLLPFINESTPGNPSYRYAPEYKENFPRLLNFVIFLDFNGDGKKDIFSQSFQGSAIEVHRNVSENDELAFEFMEFNFGAGDFLQVPAGGGFTNLFVSTQDIPGIIDHDGDGDLDIITFEQDGSFMDLFRNMAVENNLGLDTFQFESADGCWGRFRENFIDESITLSSDVDLCAGRLHDPKDGTVGGFRHAGSTVLPFDGDGDGDVDLLLGDLNNTGFVYLENNPEGGVDFMTDQDVEFPSNTREVAINTFLSASLIDVDADGKRDLIAAPNTELASDNVNHIWFYRNIGEDDAPVFEFVQEDFLLDDFLHFGFGSSPVFLDFNADGLTDLLVGNASFIDGADRFSTLTLFENIGTPTEPAYEEVDDNYLNVSAILSPNDGFLKPAVGDLDNDGDDDILIGTIFGSYYYFENTGGENQPMEFGDFVHPYFEIDPGSSTSPFIFDVDGDGLSDIISGEKNENLNGQTGVFGSLNYFNNTGNIGNPQFNPEVEVGLNTNTLGNVSTTFQVATSPETVPYVISSEDKTLLVTGSNPGFISVFEMTQNLNDTYELIMQDLPINEVGRRTAPALADIDSDDFYEMIVGNDNGGLMAFNTELRVIGETSTKETGLSSFEIVPNPTSDVIFIKESSNQLLGSTYSIIDVQGRIVQSGNLTDNNSIDVEGLSSGILFLKIQLDNTVRVEKFVKM